MTVSPELDARFRRAAADEGLLDVAYELHDSPIGRLFVAVTDRGLCEIHYDADTPVRFVPHESRPRGEAYEAFIARTGCVPTRDNLHDLFNALVWLTFPLLV